MRYLHTVLSARLGSARLLLMLLALFALNSQVQAEVIIQGLNSNKTSVLKPKLDALFQGYFKAVAAGDKESALAEYYPWQGVKPENMPEIIHEALSGVEFIKQQIDANKGIKKVEVLRVAAPDGFSEATEEYSYVNVILEVEFNNGFKDISGAFEVRREYYEGLGWGGDWKLGKGMISRPSLPLVGMKAGLKAAENYYTAALSGNVGSMEKLYSKNLSRSASSVKMIIQANGGIKNIEVKDVFKSVSGLNYSNYVRNQQPFFSIKVNYSINYNNGKTENRQGTFVLNKERWEVLKIE